MRHATIFRAAVVALLFFTLPALAMAETVRIPAGTTVYCVLDESLSTKKKSSNEHFRLGMNRFTVTAGGQSVDVLLEFEF